MLDTLYENIGVKIKNWAKWIFIIEAIGAIITGFVLLIDWGFEDGWWALFIIFFGPIVAWVGSWILYAFGQLVDDVHASRCSSDTKSFERTKAESTHSVPQNKPLENITELNVQYKSGKCDLCSTTSDQLVYCKLVDDLGTRYRTICKDCILKHGATPEK
jgi:hypothetical protein